MSTQHTPTPWFSGVKHTSIPWNARPAKDGSGDIAICFGDLPPTIIAECFVDIRNAHEDAREECVANAAHIVRCVNAWDDVEALRARINELVKS